LYCTFGSSIISNFYIRQTDNDFFCDHAHVPDAFRGTKESRFGFWIGMIKSLTHNGKYGAQSVEVGGNKSGNQYQVAQVGMGRAPVDEYRIHRGKIN
jgi:hypothetical protein